MTGITARIFKRSVVRWLAAHVPSQFVNDWAHLRVESLFLVYLEVNDLRPNVLAKRSITGLRSHSRTQQVDRGSQSTTAEMLSIFVSTFTRDAWHRPRLERW
jgi:hypothetical protein